MDKESILRLISWKQEGEYWDFKREWYKKSDKSDMLHDIICLANNAVNKESYIIIGVDEENDYLLVDVRNDSNRKKTQEIVDFLSSKKFAGDNRPVVHVETIGISDTCLDVIVIHKSSKTPFYLSENSRGLFAGNIYSRVMDTNTPKDKTADISVTEKLWRRRFGLELSSLDKVRSLLVNPKDWYPSGTDGVHSRTGEREFYNKYFPEYIIRYTVDNSFYKDGFIDKVDDDFFWINQLSRPLHDSYIYTIDVLCHNTVIYSTKAIFADNFRFNRTLWKTDCITICREKSEYLKYCYLEKDSLDYSIDLLLVNYYETIQQVESSNLMLPEDVEVLNSEYTGNNPYDVILLFENREERLEFLDYLENERDKLKEIHQTSYDGSEGEVNSQVSMEILLLNFRSKMLNSLLRNWRVESS